MGLVVSRESLGQPNPSRPVTEDSQDLGRIGTIMRLEQGPEPVFSEKYVGWIHGIGQTVCIYYEGLARLDAIA